MVAVPDLVTAATKEDGTIDLNMWKAVQTPLISHCEQNGNRMAILDAPPGMTPQQIKEWRSELAMYDSAFAALYYPWIKVENPLGVNGDAELSVPPSGPRRRRVGAHRRRPRRVEGTGQRDAARRAGHRARRHQERAGPAEPDRDQLHPLVRHLRHPDLGRPHAGQETRAGATSTSAGCSTSSRRRSTRHPVGGLRAERHDLWQRVKRTITAFLRGLWTAGALFGATRGPGLLRAVRRENNPPESIDEGKLIVEIGIAPVKPAEFVIFRISQQSRSPPEPLGPVHPFTTRSLEPDRCPAARQRPVPRPDFYLEIDGENLVLSGVSGLDNRARRRVDRPERQGRPTAAHQDARRRPQGTGDHSVTRMAPLQRQERPAVEVVLCASVTAV